jgi:hypothetical protein
LALAEEIRERVKREHGIELEYEVELWSSKPKLEEKQSAPAEDMEGES